MATETPFPKGSKLKDKKALRAIRQVTFDTEGSWRRSATQIAEDQGLSNLKNIILPEAALVGIEDQEKRTKAYSYWSPGNDWPADIIRTTLEQLGTLSKEDPDSKEAVDEFDTIQFDLEVVDEKPKGLEAFTPESKDNVLVIKCKMDYGAGWPPAAGDGSPSKWKSILVDIL